MSVIEREGIGEREREGVRERGRQREREGVVPSLPLNRLPEGDAISERTERDARSESHSHRISERQLDQVPGSERERDGGGAYSATAARRANSGLVNNSAVVANSGLVINSGVVGPLANSALVRPNSPTHLPSVKKEVNAWSKAV
jgi:hypothetical protein